MTLDKTPWTDETVMPWGKHKGTKLEDIPASYLLWCLEQKWIDGWPGLHAYLKKCEDGLLLERGSDRETTEGDSAGGTSFEDYLKEYRGF